MTCTVTVKALSYLIVRLEIVDNSGLQRRYNDDSQRAAPCLLISWARFFLTSDFLFSLMWQHGSFNQLAHLELSL